MDSLEHGVMAAQIGASRRAHAALKFGGFICEDIAVEVGQDEDLEKWGRRILMSRGNGTGQILMNGEWDGYEEI